MGSNYFCQEFEYDTSAERCWTYDRMVLQLEDCAGILQDLHPGIYFIFIFDHSYGHDIKREYGLDIKNMNSGYGGAKKETHTTNTNQEVGYLSPHESIIEIGYEKYMVSQEG